MNGRQIINTNIRLDLSREDDLRAWMYLRNMDRKQYKSYTRAVVAALNEYFSRQENLNADPYLETREKEDAFLRKVEDSIQRGIEKAKPVVQIVASHGQAVPQSEPAAAENASAKKEKSYANTREFLEAIGCYD